MFIKCNFSTNYNDGSLTILIELLKFRTNSRIIATYPGNLLWKMWIWVFEYYAMLFFFRSGLARHGWKVPYRKTNRSKNSKATLKNAPTWKLTEEKMWKLSLQIPRIDLHHILQLIIRICFLLDYVLFLRFLTTNHPNMLSLGLPVISKVFIAYLSMYLFAGKDIAQKLLLF